MGLRFRSRERSGPQARGSERSHGGSGPQPMERFTAPRGSAVPARTAHSGRNSCEFRHPVRGSDQRRNGDHGFALSEPRAKRAAGPRERAVPPCRNGLARLARQEPLTLAGILANSGTPFAALTSAATATVRLRFLSRERSGPQARGSERSHRAATDWHDLPGKNRSLRPEFLRIPAPRSRL